MGAVDTLLSGLRKREFVLRTTRSTEPVVFTTRWAMSYLRGGLTRDEVSRLMAAREPVGPGMAAPAGAGEEAVEARPTSQPLGKDESPVPPDVPASVPVRYLDPAAPWAHRAGAVAGSQRLEPAVIARLRLTFDDRYAELDHTEEWEAVFFPLGERVAVDAGLAVDYDDRDLRSEPPEGARYALGDAPLSGAAFCMA